MSRGEWDALCRKVDALERSDPLIDAAIYIRRELAEAEAEGKNRSARHSSVPGKVVVTYESGSTGTCNSPDYTRSFDAIMNFLAGDIDDIEIGRNTDGTFYASVEGVESHPSRPNRELALLSAVCRHKCEHA
jgi:hypothetical protein